MAFLKKFSLVLVMDIKMSSLKFADEKGYLNRFIFLSENLSTGIDKDYTFFLLSFA